jgi:hypothetical protein
LARAIVAEIPQLGHATYVFAKPPDVREFVRTYASTCRDDIRRNRGNVAERLGFVGRASCTAVTHAPGYANYGQGSARPSTMLSCDLKHKAIGVRKMAVRHEHRQFAERRFDPDTAIGISQTANLDAGSRRRQDMRWRILPIPSPRQRLPGRRSWSLLI